MASVDTFLGQPAVLDAASELLIAALGEKGRHARTAISTTRLPLNAPIELAASFAVKGPLPN